MAEDDPHVAGVEDVGEPGFLPAELDGEPTVDDAALAEVFAAVRSQIAVVDAGLGGFLRSRSTPTRLVLLATVSLAVFFGALALYPRADLSSYPRERWLGFSAAFLVAMCWAGSVALRPFHVAPPAPWRTYGLPAIALMLTGLQPALPEVVEEGGVAHLAAGAPQGFLALQCMFHGVLFALPGIALARLLDRGPVETLLGAGVLGALLGNLVLHAVCPITDATHLVLGHFGLALFLVAAVFGTMSLSRRLAHS